MRQRHLHICIGRLHMTIPLSAKCLAEIECAMINPSPWYDRLPNVLPEPLVCRPTKLPTSLIQNTHLRISEPEPFNIPNTRCYKMPNNYARFSHNTKSKRELPSRGFNNQSNKPNHLPATQEPTHIPLHGLKPHSSTRLALQMVEQPRQRRELLRTPPSRTVIHLGPMSRTIHMLIQSMQAAESAVADVAFEVARFRVERCRCGSHRRWSGGWVCEELLGDGVVWVATPDLG